MYQPEYFVESARCYFPHKTFNPNQLEAITEICAAFMSGKRHVVLSAPTGIGKSAIALTVHRVLKEHNKEHRTTITTSTLGLQDQYTDLDREVYDLKGKTNYDCVQGAGHYGTPKCKMLVAEGNCDRAAVCTYYKRRKIWTEQAALRLTNTAFQIKAPPVLVMDPEVRANLIVIDECHAIEHQLVNQSTIKVDANELQSLAKVAGKTLISQMADFINQFMDFDVGQPLVPDAEQIALTNKIIELLEVTLSDLDKRFKENPKVTSIAAAMEELEGFIDQLKEFTAADDEWILTNFAFATLVELKPVYARQVSDHGLFRKADQFLHMSATVCGYEAYCRNTGIKPEETVYIDIPNPIPEENRKIYNLKLMRVSGQYDKVRLAQFVDKLIKRHGVENGIIHSVSFQLAKDLQEYSDYAKRMVLSSDREEIHAALKKPNSGKIVVSPSIETGYDFPGDMSRWQIIPKVPFLYIGDPWIKLNMDRDPDWYARAVILRIVQASGRSVRGVTDHAVTYVIDDNLTRLLKNNQKLFPSWYLDAVIERG